jgi:hypothetical protein
LLNPASAFVKAAMAIYDIVMFFVNQGSQVLALMNAVIEAITAIASGAVGGAAKLVENALARSLPKVSEIVTVQTRRRQRGRGGAAPRQTTPT